MIEKENDMAEAFRSKANEIFSGSYVLKRDKLYDEAGNLLYSLDTSKGRPNPDLIIRTKLGKLILLADQPNTVELYKTQREKLGLLRLKEKDKFALEILHKNYSFTNPWAEFLSVENDEGRPVLNIEKIKGNKESQYYPFYQIHLKGDLSLVLAILVTLFFIYYQSFTVLMHPPEYSFRGVFLDDRYLKFYDSEGKLFAKTSKITPIWAILGSLVLLYGLYLLLTQQLNGFYLIILGVIIIAIPQILEFHKSSILLEETGEKIATIKTNASYSKASFLVPTINWSGKIEFFADSELPDAHIKTSDGDYILKQATILEDLNEKRIMTIYNGKGKEFLIKEENDFKYYKSLVLSTIIIKKYFVSDEGVSAMDL